MTGERNIKNLKMVVIKMPETHDSEDVFWVDGESNRYGAGYQDRETGEIGLIRCPQCTRENYIMNVPSGICTWCAFDANEKETN